MGPWTRKPDERKTKKEVEEFLKKEDELGKKSDHDAILARIDFPVFMMSDDAKGTPEANSVSREDYVKMMKPFWDSMSKDTQTMHKYTTVVLSDSLVNVTDDFTMTRSAVAAPVRGRTPRPRSAPRLAAGTVSLRPTRG